MDTYHLTPDEDRWKLIVETDGTVLFFDTKEDALAGCAEYMNEHHGSLRIHRADGRIEEERTYPRSRDPVESPG